MVQTQMREEVATKLAFEVMDRSGSSTELHSHSVHPPAIWSALSQTTLEQLDIHLILQA